MSKYWQPGEKMTLRRAIRESTNVVFALHLEGYMVRIDVSKAAVLRSELMDAELKVDEHSDGSWDFIDGEDMIKVRYDDGGELMIN